MRRSARPLAPDRLSGTTWTLLLLALVALSLLGSAAGAGAKRVPGTEGKLDSKVRDLVAAKAANRDLRREGNIDRSAVDGTGRVLVDIYVRGDAADAARQLADVGMEITGSTNDAPVAMVEGWLPVSQAASVARLEVTQAVATVTATGTDAQDGVDVGAVTSAGDTAHHGPQARALGVAGAGVTVGVMSDSINRVGPGVAGSQATGDLPANVQVLADGPPGSSDEGRAMAEIVYDTAPGITNMLFAAGGPGPVGKANNIDALRASGAQIIADDTFYLTEPFFQDGVVAQAVDAAKTNGVAYFASAGNRARQSWEGTYVNGAGNLNDFGGGDQLQSIATVAPGDFIQISLQWDEAFGQAVTDLECVPVRHVQRRRWADRDQRGRQPERDPQPVRAPHLSQHHRQSKDRRSGDPALRWHADPFIKWIGFGGTYNIEHNTNSDAINPDAASARGSLAVAAIAANENGNNDPEPFSSAGTEDAPVRCQRTRLSTPLVLQKPQSEPTASTPRSQVLPPSSGPAPRPPVRPGWRRWSSRPIRR